MQKSAFQNNTLLTVVLPASITSPPQLLTFFFVCCVVQHGDHMPTTALTHRLDRGFATHTHTHIQRPSQQRLSGQHCRLFSCTYYYHLLLLLHSVRPCLSLCSQHYYYYYYCHGVLVICIDLVSHVLSPSCHVAALLLLLSSSSCLWSRVIASAKSHI